MELKTLLSEHSFKFKKSLGQNFLTDGNLLRAIAADGAEPGDTVVEVGAGAGTLTAALSERVGGGRVIAFEIDKALEPILNKTLAGLNNVRLIFADALKMPPEQMLKTVGSDYKVAANLPYYITSPLIFYFLELPSPPSALTVMVQKEVADRLSAQAGTPEYGALTAAVQISYTVKTVRKVSRNMFTPAPDVDSAVVRLVKNNSEYTAERLAAYKKVVRAAFMHRRKTLVNNLLGLSGVTRAAAESALTELGKNVKIRGEELSPPELMRLADIILQP